MVHTPNTAIVLTLVTITVVLAYKRQVIHTKRDLLSFFVSISFTRDSTYSFGEKGKSARSVVSWLHGNDVTLVRIGDPGLNLRPLAI